MSLLTLLSNRGVHNTKTLTALVSPAGTVVKKTTHFFAASTTPSGSIRRATAHRLLASVTPTATFIKRTARKVTASLSLTGTLRRATLKALPASITPSGAILKGTAHRLQAQETFAGSINLHTTHPISSALNVAGALTRRTTHFLSATLPSSGVLNSVVRRVMLLVGSITPAATLRFATSFHLAAAITLAPTLIRRTTHGLAGVITPSGTLAEFRIFMQALAGGLTFAPRLVMKTSTRISAALGFSPSLTRRTSHALTGSITPAGLLNALRGKLMVFSASLSPNGSLRFATFHGLSAALTMAPTLAKRTFTTLRASFTPSGALQALRVHLMILSAVISPSGRLALNIRPILTGTLTFAPTMGKKVTHQMAAALQSGGALRKLTSTRLFASLTPNGVITRGRGYLQTLTAAITPAGGLARRTGKVHSASVLPAGGLRKATHTSFVASLLFAPGLVKRTATSFGATLSFVGNLLERYKAVGVALGNVFATFDSYHFGLFGRMGNAIASLYGRFTKDASSTHSTFSNDADSMQATFKKSPDDLSGTLQ